MATLTGFLKTVLLLASALQLCHGQCDPGTWKFGNGCVNGRTCNWNDPCSYGCFCIQTSWDDSRCGCCQTGYQYNTVTSRCEDINECLNTCKGDHEMCTNTPGSFSCDCSRGYRWNYLTGSCTDINECESSPCQHGTCHNTEGGFQCNCSTGFIGTSCDIEAPDLSIKSSEPVGATGERLKAMFWSEELYTGSNVTWTCTVEATDCSAVNVTVALNVSNGDHWTWYGPSYFALPGGERLGETGEVFRQAAYTSPFNVELRRVSWSTLKFAYITVSANSSLTMVCGRPASASIPTDACNHCQPSPCVENTTCQDIRGDFLCLCPEGFVNALDNHTCAERPDLVLDSQDGRQTSGLEVRAMFDTASTEAGQNWTCAVEAVDCSIQEVTLRFTVSENYQVSSVVSISGGFSMNESTSTANATLQSSPAGHYIERRGMTPLRFVVEATRPVYVVLQASRNVTVMCEVDSEPAVPTSRCSGAMANQSFSSVLIPLIAGLGAAVVVIVIVIIVVFKRKWSSAGEKERGGDPVRFNDLRQREEQASAGAQRAPSSGAPASQGTGAVYAVVSKPKGGKAGKASRVTPPAYAVVNKAKPPCNGNRASGVSNQIYSLATGDNPPPYDIAMAIGPDMKAAVANQVAAQGTSQTAKDLSDYDVLGQNRRPSKPARDVTYGHLGEVGGDDAEYGYDHTGVRSAGDVINSVYDTAQAPSAPHDDVTADDTYDRMNLGQGQRKEVVGSTYDRVDPTYANTAPSAK